ncbi:MAG: Signal peptidase [Verrucomicrobiaceae bacterium]|nr:Signal peptidase [Verrucomicrobiaceae bacterium]
MWPFDPRYIKQAKLLHKGVSRFLDYKRDILPVGKVTEISGLRDQLAAAMKARDGKKIDELHESINTVCERALPNLPSSDIADNVEVFFVAIVVALGIRAYIAQPFQIPTGSMQPTLNGYKAEGTEEDTSPNFFQRLWERKNGASYVNVVSDHDGYLADGEYVTEHRWLLLFTYSQIHFKDGHTISVSAPKRQLQDELGLTHYVNAPTKIAVGPDGRELRTPDDRHVSESYGRGIYVSTGQLLARGVLHTGDNILVNKFAYHFRKPKRGEVWVFTTKHIQGIENTGSFDREQGSQHYIKRLAAVPGDHWEIRPPELWINGKAAGEFGMKRVAAREGPYKSGYVRINGYPGAVNEGTLGSEEYLALGDNSTNSADGRYWGPVPERNVVGPALFCYWPLGDHWGPIW